MPKARNETDKANKEKYVANWTKAQPLEVDDELADIINKN